MGKGPVAQSSLARCGEEIPPRGLPLPSFLLFLGFYFHLLSAAGGC